ncbi:MAG: 4'-phosphopantetheinyl transferase superfamily protein [Caulobacter sp.]|nr:4'-phosphopantetheinyl transferase superfamily protein [Caulobacter sp.]
MDGRPRYAVRRLPGYRPGQRPPKALESAEARALQAELDPAASVFSRSHGRGLIAAAVAAPPVTRVGIDVEWIDPGRRLAAIAEHYLGAAEAVTPEQFFRGWTFGEAWFKAFGRDPTADLIRMAGGNLSEAPLAVGDAWLLQTLPEPGFVLSLVWTNQR